MTLVLADVVAAVVAVVIKLLQLLYVSRWKDRPWQQTAESQVFNRWVSLQGTCSSHDCQL